MTIMAENTGNEAKLLCLNIGKADCMLLFYRDTRWLIDTGYFLNYGAVKAALAEYHVDHLNGVFLTHCHEDHCGGLRQLARSAVAVDAWYASPLYMSVSEGRHPMVLVAQQRGREVTWLSAGTTIPVGPDATFTVLGPLRLNAKNENNNSLVLAFSSPAGRILLCGDMKKKEEADLVDAGNVLPCALMKAGHHGDAGVLSDAFLAAAKPQVTVISTCTAQEPDTPAPSTLRRLRDIGCVPYVTQDFHDAVLFTLSGGLVTAVEDIRWTGVPPRINTIAMKIDLTADTITLRNTGTEAVSLDRYSIFSTNGNESILLDGLTLEPGGRWVIGSLATKIPADQTWDRKRVWSETETDVGTLYDPWGRPVASADNGLRKITPA